MLKPALDSFVQTNPLPSFQPSRSSHIIITSSVSKLPLTTHSTLLPSPPLIKPYLTDFVELVHIRRTTLHNHLSTCTIKVHIFFLDRWMEFKLWIIYLYNLPKEKPNPKVYKLCSCFTKKLIYLCFFLYMDHQNKYDKFELGIRHLISPILAKVLHNFRLYTDGKVLSFWTKELYQPVNNLFLL